MPLQETSGAASYDAFGGGAAAIPSYIEDVFSTFLYTQNTSSQNIPLQTGVGFTSSDAWQSNTLLTTNTTLPICTIDSDGNYYLTAGNGSEIAYVTKFTPTGSQAWQIRLLPASVVFMQLSGIRVAPSGAVYVCGSRNNVAFVCKLTSSGVVSWTRELTETNVIATSMELDSSENVHLAYTDSSNQGAYARFNSSGTQDTANSKTFVTSIQTDCRGITVDSSGNVYICGRWYDGSSYSGYVIKFNSSMTVQWARSLTGTGGDPKFAGVSVDSSGNVYVAGDYRATNDRPLFAKYNSSGTLQWQKNFFQTGASFQAKAIKVDASGNSYVGGLGPNQRWFIARIDTNGDIVWQKVLRPTRPPNTSEANAIDVDSLGGLLVSGRTNESTSGSTVRAQVLKISQSGLSNGVTAYGTLAASSLNYGNASTSAPSTSFSVSSGPSSSTVTYTNPTSTVSTVLQNIPLSTSTGALLWIKNRTATSGNIFALSNTSYLESNTTGAAFTQDYALELVSNGALIKNAATTDNWVSWTFREQPKFFDVVTYTGDGANRTIAHNLGSVPGCIIVKRTDTTADWQVYHRSLANTQYMVLNTTAAVATGATRWNSTTPTSTVFSLGTDATVNASGGTYVAYIYAHNAGGFGLTGTDNVISCGSFTTDGSGAVPAQNLGYEPQWILYKSTNSTGNWIVGDTMRGIRPNSAGSANNTANVLYPNLSDAEFLGGATFFTLSPTGFFSNANFGAAQTFIYIAIRRGPMKVPTTGTSVFGLNARTGTGANATVTGGDGVTDLAIIKNRGAVSGMFVPRLTGTGYLVSSEGGSETAAATSVLQANPWDVMNGIKVGTVSVVTNASANTFINYLVSRAPGFFDVVCYTGTGVARTIAHNLRAVPELMIVKSRNVLNAWQVYSATLGATQVMQLNTTGVPSTSATMWNNTAPTSSVFTLGNNSTVNTTSDTYIAYLFDTCPGVSSVGSFTGTGATQTINCGFTGGARFVLIKSTSTTGDWFYWDSARGIVAGDDPYLTMNQSAAEVTNTDWVDTAATGFELSNAGGNLANSNGVSYIFLAIA